MAKTPAIDPEGVAREWNRQALTRSRLITRVGNDSQGLSWSGLLSLGAVSACLMVAGFGIGWWADGALHTSPILAVLGIAVGLFAAGCYTVVRVRGYLRE